MMTNSIFSKKRIVVCSILVSVAAGCAAGPRPASLIRSAKRDYTKGNTEAALASFEQAIAISPSALEKNRFADELEMYRDAQITYGTEMAAKAEADGKLLEAWIWYVQVSTVSPDREECRAAADSAARVKLHLAKEYYEKSRRFAQTGDTESALIHASQSLWFGYDEAIEAFGRAANRLSADINTWQLDPVQEQDVHDLVRTNSIERVTQTKTFAPYGLPIYFGDVPMYYVSLGTITVKGYPIPQEVPSQYAKMDALSQLTRKAQKKFGPDALINVHFWTKSRKAFTVGEAVKFVVFNEDAGGRTVTVGLGEISPELPLPRNAADHVVSEEKSKQRPRARAGR